MLRICGYFIDGNGSTVRFFQEIDTAQKRCLSGSAGTDDGNDLAAFYFQADIIQNRLPAECFFQVFYL